MENKQLILIVGLILVIWLIGPELFQFSAFGSGGYKDPIITHPNEDVYHLIFISLL